MSGPVRLRFAPAPTGYMHVGSARTALFNWLYARHVGGELVLRIEDTNITDDTAAEVEHFVSQILASLDWLGITFDGEPVRQSQRTDQHKAAVDKLLADGRAYEHEGAVKFRVHDEKRGADGEVSPTTVEINDVIRGQITWATADIDDFVIQRSDGRVMFTMANAVDDLEGGITHIVRGEDLLNPTPRAVLLRQALDPDAPTPTFAHLPLLLGDDRTKLSKRRHAVAVDDFRTQGVLAEAMVNYLALLGWGPKDDVEVRPIDEIAEMFDLADVNASAALFDTKKLAAINGAYIRQLSPEGFAAAAEPWLAESSWGADLEPTERQQQVARLAPLIQERTTALVDVPDALGFFFARPERDDGAWVKACDAVAKATGLGLGDDATNGDVAAALCGAAADVLEAVAWEAQAIGDALRNLAEVHGLKLRAAQMPVRVAITGNTVGPPLFESIEHLGRDEAVTRLRSAT